MLIEILSFFAIITILLALYAEAGKHPPPAIVAGVILLFLGYTMLVEGIQINNGQTIMTYAVYQNSFPNEGIILWLKADEITNKSDDDPISTWSDIGEVTQTNPSNQPTYKTNILNGKPTVQFRSEYQQTLTTNTNFPAPVSVIYVVRQTSMDQYDSRMLSGMNNNWLLGYWTLRDYTGWRQNAYFEGWVTCEEGCVPTDTNWHVYTAIETGVVSSAYEDGVLIASNSNGITGPNGLSLGGTTNFVEYSSGDIAELIVYNRAVKEDERKSIECYLNKKYALSLGECE